jgi:Na+/H+-dicarboxylate symporter
VVLFSIALGVALIGVDKKGSMLDGMSLVIDLLTRIANFVVRLTPIGVFAIMASASGTLSFAEFVRLEVYLYSYIALSLVMALWVLPGLVTALTPLRYRDVVGSTKDALVTAFATGSLFVVLPILMEKSKELICRYAENKEAAESSVEVIVPASFNFPHAGKLFTLSFVLFAGWFSGYAVEVKDYPLLPVPAFHHNGCHQRAFCHTFIGYVYPDPDATRCFFHERPAKSKMEKDAALYSAHCPVACRHCNWCAHCVDTDFR